VGAVTGIATGVMGMTGQQQMLRPELHALALANPLSSELGVMRTTLLGGLVSSLKRNVNRQVSTLRLFETGLRFLANPDQVSVDLLDKYVAATHGAGKQVDDTVQQQEMLAGLVAGKVNPENWNSDAREVDFYSVKSDVENLFMQANGHAVRFVESDLPMLHPGQQAVIELDGLSIGYLGVLNPALLRQLDLEIATVVFEFSMAALCRKRVPTATPLSRFPQVRRDLALLVDDSVSYQQISDVVRDSVPDILADVIVFDVYRGDNIDKGKKSIAIGLILQDFSRTLHDRDIEKVVLRVKDALSVSLGAVLRV
jgi:phenylalanyl-tRNA synthetase beta chain